MAVVIDGCLFLTISKTVCVNSPSWRLRGFCKRPTLHRKDSGQCPALAAKTLRPLSSIDLQNRHVLQKKP